MECNIFYSNKIFFYLCLNLLFLKMTALLIIVTTHSPLAFILLIYAHILLCSCGESQRNILTSSQQTCPPSSSPLSDTQFALAAALANNSLWNLLSFSFATTLNLNLYKLCPDSSVCLFKVRTFTLSPKAILRYGDKY